MKKWIPIVLIVFVAILFRLYRIDTNSHFLGDESRDLVNIHQIFVERKITLVGPISDDGQHLFSSLTYYLLLPFAVIANFDPIGTVYGAVFWGIMTFIIFGLLVYKINPKMLIPAIILAAIWWPLIETSRWPWNPNFVPFWIALSIYLSLFKGKKFQLLSGISAGMSLHHHFLAIISAGFVWLKNKSPLSLLGSFLAVLPFILFDFRHPPGLFFSKLITFGGGQPLKFVDIIPKFIEGVRFSVSYIFPGNIFVVFIGLIVIALFVWDVKYKSKNVFWGVSTILSLSVFVVYSRQMQYLLGTLPLFWMWLFLPRKKFGHNISIIIIALICISSLIKYSQTISVDDFTGNISLVSGASTIIKQQIDSQKLVNANLAVLGGVDEEGLGKRYRGVLLTWNVSLKSKDEYTSSDNLFVITQSSANILKSDPAAQMSNFKNGPVIGTWEIPKSNWRVIQFNRY